MSLKRNLYLYILRYLIFISYLQRCKNDAAAILPATGTIKNALKYLNNRYSLPDCLSLEIGLTLPWKFAVGDRGNLLAILQDNLIEIRKSKDEYSSVVGKASGKYQSFFFFFFLSLRQNGGSIVQECLFQLQKTPFHNGEKSPGVPIVLC